MAISADGSHVYFVAKGVLSAAANSNGETAQDGAENLYVFERDTAFPQGRVKFVAQLASSDREEWVGGPGEANVTPDGRFLVFTSGGELTPDDTRTDGAQQVFRYDAQTERLTRISIGQNGFDDNGNGSSGRECLLHYACPDNASIVPAAVGSDQAGPSRSDPTMAHSGAFVFFESPLGLTPQALDNAQIGTSLRPIGPGEPGPEYAQNVYEWEQEGFGSCPAGQSSGCVDLISDGKDTAKVGSESAVKLLGSDAGGANVFFTTADPLLPQDSDTQVDIYDARICEPGGGNPCIQRPVPPPPACQGDECHGLPAVGPSAPVAASALVGGDGNLSPGGVPAARVKARPPSRAQKLAQAMKLCRKDRLRSRRARCEAAARRQYGPRRKPRRPHPKKSRRP
jgi:hypothetical protein